MIRVWPARLVISVLFALSLQSARFSAAQQESPTKPEVPEGQTTTSADEGLAITGLTGRWVWGDAGAVRLSLLDPQWQPSEGSSSISVKIANEGEEAFVISPKDSWSLVTSENKTIPLELDRNLGQGTRSGKTITIQPHDWMLLSLTPEGKFQPRITAIRYRSRRLEREYEARSAYRPAAPRLVVPPILPLGALASNARAVVSLAASVGPNGHVERVYQLQAPKAHEKRAFSEAAKAALRQWVFDPAIVDGEATKSLYFETFESRGASMAQGVLPLSAAVVSTRLGTLFRDSFTRVIPLPRADGFVILGRKNETTDVGYVQAFLIRVGTQPDGTGTWVVVNAFGLRRPTGGRSCDCALREPQGAAAQELLEWLSSRLGTALSSVSLLYPFGRSLIPSGLLEPEDRGTWNRSAVRRLLLRSIAGGASGGTDLVADLPDEAEILIAQGPVPLGEGTVPPIRTRKVSPEYPEAARRARDQGAVRLEAIIDREGNVTELNVVEGSPLLVDAATAAVCCWKYRPATFKGKPVEISFTVVVSFVSN